MSNYSTDADLLNLEYTNQMKESSRLRTDVDDSITTFELDNVKAFGSLINDDDTALIGAEQVTITAIDLAQRTVTVVRGANSTSAAAHTDGDTIQRHSFKSYHSKAKAIIDRKLINMGIDINWEGIGAKLLDITELVDVSSYLTLHLLFTAQAGATDSMLDQKAQAYHEKYLGVWSDLNPRTVDIDDTLIILTYDGTTYTDVTTELSTDQGESKTIIADSASAIFVGRATTHETCNVRTLITGDYTGLNFSVLDASGAEQDANETDSTDGFTEIGAQTSFSYDFDNGAPYLLQSQIRPMSRYWLKISASAVTRAATVTMLSPEQTFIDDEYTGPGEEMLVGA